MSRDYCLLCLECARKSNEILEKDESFLIPKEAMDIDDIYFLNPVNCDTSFEKIEPLDIEHMLEWVKTHSSHGKIAFEVVL